MGVIGLWASGALMKFILVFIVLLATAVSAEAINIDTVPVGNPGNPADTRYNDFYHPNGVGSVAYSFRISKTEVTNAQYVVFLNSVAASDQYGLYSEYQDDPCCSNWGGILRSGSPGSYSYAVRSPVGSYIYDDKPAVLVTPGNVMRFANWLHNGQPTGSQNASTTEDGAYTLNGAVTDLALAAVTRNPGARWWLPSENEWYKAAYHKNDGVTGNYWDYPTATNSVRNNNLPSSDTGNSANFYNSGYTTGNFTYHLTDVGAYSLSGSPYGTFDQGGSVWEWNETLFGGYLHGVRGGSWNGFDNNSHDLHASFPIYRDSTSESDTFGFRVASSIPEPSALLLTIMAFATMLVQRRKSIPDNRV